MTNQCGTSLRKECYRCKCLFELRALPNIDIGLLMENKTMRIACALRLGSKVCEPHTCVCGASADSMGHHGLSCNKSAGRHSRHSQVNDIICRALTTANIAAHREPTGMFRSDGKRPDGITLVPWRRGKCMVWDATIVDTFAASHILQTAKEGGAAAMKAENSKWRKYNELEYESAKAFITELGKRMSQATNNLFATSQLRQQLSVAIQRGNGASVIGTLPSSSFLF